MLLSISFNIISDSNCIFVAQYIANNHINPVSLYRKLHSLAKLVEVSLQFEGYAKMLISSCDFA